MKTELFQSKCCCIKQWVIDELQVNDKEECLEKIRTNGIYFETPDISTITNKILPVSYVSNLTSGIVKVDMQGYILKK